LKARRHGLGLGAELGDGRVARRGVLGRAHQRRLHLAALGVVELGPLRGAVQGGEGGHVGGAAGGDRSVKPRGVGLGERAGVLVDGRQLSKEGLPLEELAELRRRLGERRGELGLGLQERPLAVQRVAGAVEVR
jgi:hypothetical protein